MAEGMAEGRWVLQWAHQHGYSVEWITEEIGYSHRVLAMALNRNRITPNMAEALYRRFGIRVRPTTFPCDYDDHEWDDC